MVLDQQFCLSDPLARDRALEDRVLARKVLPTNRIALLCADLRQWGRSRLRMLSVHSVRRRQPM